MKNSELSKEMSELKQDTERKTKEFASLCDDYEKELQNKDKIIRDMQNVLEAQSETTIV